ncbi:enoyl-CoA hydratase/isomerase family protein [Talaromyces stipitatus ATCC 10500]|uniref:Enoyl-CoA hydratase/isomerase family protein n=1 Tax=Talaromyces stipitatus (strain ATCC 10500 / CBS 375.48 / QM 6759 / NRRL 1006) TaxID=441959 RepID=B8MRT1_TALSN|nr:enoyl-CoA hydratase/isomerase family protein [Talaromyces stipitatus ATCC 10500]EED13265.1 enoyl-CoA hydratase/isomerase family protein [Talaromyces stipitatus ATCC 10500]
MSSPENSVEISKTPEGITTITLNRPHRRNAIDHPTAKTLYHSILDFENDETQKVGILYGAGGSFCAGFDLHEVAKASSSSTSGNDEKGNQYKGPRFNVESERVQGRNAGPIGPSRLQVRKPLISAVAGYAVAGGLELSLIADIRVAEENAIFGVFCRRFGVPLIDGGTVRLQAIIGLGRALDMILTGRGVTAQEGLQMGLVNRVVGQGEALNEAVKIAKQLVAFPQLCMNVDRASCYYAAYEASSFQDALRNEFGNGERVIMEEGVYGAANLQVFHNYLGQVKVEEPTYNMILHGEIDNGAGITKPQKAPVIQPRPY